MIQQSTSIQPSSHEGIIYDVLKEADLDQVIECIVHTFADGDPLARAVALNESELKTFITIFLKNQILEDGLSVIARDEKNGRVIGGLLITDLLADPPAAMDGLSDKMLPLLALFDHLDGLYLAEHDVKKGEVLHVIMEGVAPDVKNNGIGFRMLIKGYEIAKAKNYKSAIAEITGATSQHVAAKYGARELYSQKYNDFVFEGTRPFQNITDCESIKLMSVDL